MALTCAPTRPRVVAVVPAHDEAATIAAAVRSLQEQVVPPDAVLVVADNCTDETAEIARSAGALVFTSVGNTRRKAGALNQALTAVLGVLGPDDVVFVMDADSTVAPGWLEHALPQLERPAVGAVGGIFYAGRGLGLIGYLQRLEYVRYARQLARRRDGRAFVLTGTASAFRASTLQRVADARTAGDLPGSTPGRDVFYDEQNITEDSEITLAVKTLGLQALSPMDCWVATEVMPTWRQLWVQRKRWQRGALENLGTYGLTRVTLPYAARQVWSFLEIAVFTLYLSLTAAAVLAGTFRTTPLWLAVGALFVVERVVSVRAAGWRAMCFAGVLVVESAYGLFKHAVNLRCLYEISRGRSAVWS